MERPQMGPTKRCLATDLCNHLSSPQLKQQVTSQLEVESITAKILTKDQLKLYLDHPPAGKKFCSGVENICSHCCKLECSVDLECSVNTCSSCSFKS